MIAYILLNVRPGKEEEILHQIKNNEEVSKVLKEAVLVYGEYDIVLRLEVESIEVLRNIVLNNIRRIEGVERTTTLISTNF